jgi:hypothetical protein
VIETAPLRADGPLLTAAPLAASWGPRLARLRAAARLVLA